MIGWYEAQKQRDAATKADSEALIVPEKRVFEEAMGFIITCLDLVQSAAPIEDLVTKRKLALSMYGFDVLWTAWDAMLAGRYGVPTSLWRTISHTSDLLSAIHANPNLAHEMGRTDPDEHAARSAIRDELNSLSAGSGTEWFESRRKEEKRLNRLAHVTADSTGATLAVKIRDGVKIGFLRPGGVLGELQLEAIAIYLSDSAVDLLGSTVLALQHTAPEIEGLWRSTVKVRVEAWVAVLQEELSQLRAPTGDVQQIGLLRWDEELA